jgi:hypothetical protein
MTEQGHLASSMESSQKVYMRASSRTPRNRGRKAVVFEATICSLLRRELESLKPQNFAFIVVLFTP